jgi:nitroimidazol reductase NimA-like FMN-containing flavoprotein (pyridoxamine 5'-phosphate oxidase superfamily)
MTILDLGQPGHAAADARLRDEPIAWLTTVAGSGQPQSTPVWFLWEDGEFLIYGAARGPKTRSIEARAAGVPAYVAKYRELIAGNGWTPGSFADLYPHVIRVTPTRARIW